MIAQLLKKVGFRDSLPSLAADASDSHQRLRSPIHFLFCQSQHRFQQSEPRAANCELGCVNSHRQAARARCDVVSRQCTLVAFIQAAARINRQGMSRNDQPI